MNHTDARAAVIAEARTWLRTPYHHHQCLKGVGVDCAMLLVGVYRACGFVPAEYYPDEYSPEWYLHRDQPLFLEQLERFAKPIAAAAALPADIAMCSFGRHAAHGLILLDETYALHAYRPHRCVEIIERRSLESRIESYWSVF
jgi:cell wall-associated NlpC family hydrolase